MPHLKEQLNHLTRSIKKRIYDAKKIYFEKIEADCSVNPGNFWNFVNKSRSKSRIPEEMKVDNSTFDNNQAIVDAFADYFSSVYLPCDTLAYDVKCTPYINQPSDFQLSVNEVSRAMKSLNTKCTAGVDEIPSFFLKSCHSILSQPLCYIFNATISSGTFPIAWKITKVVPIFKSGDKSDVKNYRPISIITNFAKIFERSIANHINHSMLPIIADEQHGCINNRSTSTNLICITEYINQTIANGHQLDVIYTDLAKAFDRVDHDILFSNLSLLNLHPDLFTLLKSYLVGRPNIVQYNGFSSHSFVPTSGVPQGSVLGAPLFNLFINDVTKFLNVNKLLYVDDLKIFHPIKSQDDADVLQSNLNLFGSWCSQNNLTLNLNKCYVVSYTRRETLIDYQYSIFGTDLVRNQTIMDLGVLFDSKLTFIPHIESVELNAAKSLGSVLRNSGNFTKVDTFIKLFNAYVLSKFNYATIPWNPTFNKYIMLLEKIQKRFLKFLVFRSTKIYPPRGSDYIQLCAQFNFITLAERRFINQSVFLYKLINFIINCPCLLELIKFRIPQHQSRYYKPFLVSMPRSSIGFSAPIFNMCNGVNVMCSQIDIDIDLFNTALTTFKQVVKNYIITRR